MVRAHQLDDLKRSAERRRVGGDPAEVGHVKPGIGNLQVILNVARQAHEGIHHIDTHRRAAAR